MKRFHSLRWRLQFWLAFLLLLVLTGFGATVYQLQRLERLGQIDDALQRRIAALNTMVRNTAPQRDMMRRRMFDRAEAMNDGPPPMRPRGPGPNAGPGPGPRGFPRTVAVSPAVAELFPQPRTNGFYFTAWSREGLLLIRSTNSPGKVPRPSEGHDTLMHVRMRGPLREAYQFTEMGDCVLAGREITSDLAALRRLKMLLFGAGSAVLALGLGGGWWLTVRAIRPVEKISAAARRISEGNLSERIPAADTDNELDRLAGVLNSAFARLEAAFSRQKQFTADASHELRTPLTVIISEGQSALARSRSSAEYQEALTTCVDAAQQMRQLTDSLLQLARTDAGETGEKWLKVDLAEVAQRVVNRVQRLAVEKEVRLQCEPGAALAFSRQPEQLERLLMNLVSNALHYNRAGGEVTVSTGVRDGKPMAEVRDTGIGIAAEDLPHVFERFYRADKVRSQAEGRMGLGLAICQAIAREHSGNISVESALGLGSTFTLLLPALPPGMNPAAAAR